MSDEEMKIMLTLYKLIISACLTLIIKGGVALAGHSIAWWVAGLIALVAVFGGFLWISDGGDDD
jgi:hypothetical protein